MTARFRHSNWALTLIGATKIVGAHPRIIMAVKAVARLSTWLAVGTLLTIVPKALAPTRTAAIAPTLTTATVVALRPSKRGRRLLKPPRAKGCPHWFVQPHHTLHHESQEGYDDFNQLNY